jgi:hypothetical protein
MLLGTNPPEEFRLFARVDRDLFCLDFVLFCLFDFLLSVWKTPRTTLIVRGALLVLLWFKVRVG